MNKVVHKSTEWIYRGLWRGLVDWFRVPDRPPDLPVKPGEYIARFQPGEGFLRYLKFLFWVFLLSTDIVLTIAWIAASWALCENDLWWVAVIIAPFALAIIVVPDIIAYIAIHLRYDTTWYVMTDRSLRIRRGIWIIHETTITFENVQNIKVQQGPVQRHYGIANLVVETAGAGASHGKGGQSSISNQGIIEGVSNAQELRDRILLRLKASKTAGLGDEDDSQHASAGRSVAAGGAGALKPTFAAAHVAALREIRDAVRVTGA